MSNRRRGGADRRLTFISGRNGSKIGPYSQLRGQSVGRSQTAPEQNPVASQPFRGADSVGYGSKLRSLLLAPFGHAAPGGRRLLLRVDRTFGYRGPTAELDPKRA